MMTAADLDFGFAPKAVGALHVSRATAPLPLVRLMFSSIAALLGNLGQANYASANGYIDCAAHAQRRHGVHGASLQIPAVSGAGMGASTFSAQQLDEIGSITLD